MTRLEAGELGWLADMSAAALATTRRDFDDAVRRARLFVLPDRIPAPAPLASNRAVLAARSAARRRKRVTRG